MKNVLIITFVYICFSLTSISAQNKIPGKATGGVCNDQAIYFPQPDYPKAANVSGNVNVQIRIDEKGNVEAVTAIFGHPLLRPNAEKAAREAKFKPTVLLGKPVKVSCVLVYKLIPPESIQLVKNVENNQHTLIPELRQSIGIINKKASYIPKLIYPRSCRCSGSIIVEVIINIPTGQVVRAKVISGHPLLRISALESANRAVFKVSLAGQQRYVKGLLIYKVPPSS